MDTPGSPPLQVPLFDVINPEPSLPGDRPGGRPGDPESPRAWVVSANMGLGHLRAAYPLIEMSPQGVIAAGDPAYVSEAEYKLWRRMRRTYEILSRSGKIPIIGPPLFSVLSKIADIHPYYPRRDLSRPTLQVQFLKYLFNRGMGTDLVEHLRSRQELPMVNTFYASALAADRLGYPRIYLVVTDSDINRVWVAEHPAESRITYLAPCGYARNRLLQYGIPDERILITGFPLPRECVGRNALLLCRDLGVRLQLLDPRSRFWCVHRVEAEHYLGSDNCRRPPDRPLTLMFAVGGAGAQAEIGVEILRSLRQKILGRQIRYWMVAGVRSEVAGIFQEAIHREGLEEVYGPFGYVNILLGNDLNDYFRRFNQALRQTDLLWTKPSELSFYSGLGIPLILAPPIGPHEESNRKWLFEIRGAVDQLDPRYTDEWLFDLIHAGRLARTAMDGFLYARSMGTYKIEEVVRTGTVTHEVSPACR